jgi:lambda repressor-like predicted transcriptional regulator
LPARLVLSGRFTVTDAQQRRLQQQATRLGFADLRACLQALLDDGWSVPQLATHLDTTQAIVCGAIAAQHLQPLPRHQRLARQRQRAAQQRARDHAAALGFENMRAYLEDRLVTKVWTLTQIQEELGVAPATLRHLLDQHQVRRVTATRRQRTAAAAAVGPATQARAVQQHRQARLAELGFGGLEEYVQDRHGRRGWPLRRLCTELGVGYDWLSQQLDRLGLQS